MVNIISLYGFIITIISFIDCKYIYNENIHISSLQNKYTCLTNITNNYIEFACQHFYFYLKITFNKTKPNTYTSINSTNITSISYNSFSSIKITFNQSNEYIILSIPQTIIIQEDTANHTLYLPLNITNTSPNMLSFQNKTMFINLNTFLTYSLDIYDNNNNKYIILNIQFNDYKYIYIRKFSFRYTYSSNSGFYGNLFITLGLFIAFRGYSKIDFSLILITICCFQIAIEEVIEMFPGSVSFSNLYVTFASISSIIFGLFAGLFMTYKNYYMFPYYVCLFGTVYKCLMYFCFNILIQFPQYMEYINTVIMIIGSIVFGCFITFSKAGDNKYRNYIGMITTSLFGVNLLITGLSLMVKNFYYDRYFYIVKLDQMNINAINYWIYLLSLIVICLIPLGLQYIGINLNESALSSVDPHSFVGSQKIRKVIENIEESELFPGEPNALLGNENMNVNNEKDNHSARITHIPSNNSEDDKKDNYGIDNNYIVTDGQSYDRNYD